MPLIVKRSFPVATCQSFTTDLSPEANVFPSGLNAVASSPEPLWCPDRIARNLQVATSQMHILFSRPAEASSDPS